MAEADTKPSAEPRLPDKPSELIRVALADLAKCQADERYEINMEEWHRPQSRSNGYEFKCLICFAGAAMSQSLGAAPDIKAWPEDFDDPDRRRLLALDAFREGYVKAAVQTIDANRINSFLLPRKVSVTHFEADPAAWRADMEKIATMLEEAGL